MSLSDYEILTITGSLIIGSFGAGFALCNLLKNKQINETTLDDSCLAPRGIFGNRPYKMQRVFFNGKCKTVNCDFLGKDNNCDILKKRCSFIE